MNRYFLAQDNSSHWYIVPADKRAEWEEWVEIPEDDEEGWSAPDWVRRCCGGPESVTFYGPVEDCGEEVAP